MKRFFLFFVISVIIASCSTQKNVVRTNNYSQNTTPLPPPSNTPNNHSFKPVKDSVATVDKTTTVPTTPARPVYSKPFVVVDSRGRIMVTKEQLPDNVSTDLNALKSVRAYTPDQAKNLNARYNYIPPKVIYVPSSLVKKGKKGLYYTYNQKFFYWKKEDGFFYLDENYYN
ncbi:MAG: hypothetical protein LBE82_12915 [Chitinophagaceae bacterium]|jgi:hypothetical protein|nr:hypothetical protein [Chitinophagaceae bacterium]